MTDPAEKWKAMARELLSTLSDAQDSSSIENDTDAIVAALAEAYAAGRAKSWAAGYKAGKASLKAEVEWFRAGEQKP